MLLGTTQPRGCISFSWIPAVHPNSTSECSESLTEVVIASMIFGLVSLQLLHLELQQYSGSSWRKQKQIKETGGGHSEGNIKTSMETLWVFWSRPLKKLLFTVQLLRQNGRPADVILIDDVRVFFRKKSSESCMCPPF